MTFGPCRQGQVPPSVESVNNSRVAHQAQRDALKAAARQPATVHRREQEQAIEHYLRIQNRLAQDRLAERHSDGSRHHEQVTVEGRSVEVTEDNLGIVELHLS